MKPQSRHRVIVVIIAAIVLHALVLFVAIPVVSANLATSYNQDRFTDGYDQLAANLAAGNGYRFYPDTAKTLMREPGYPVILAALLFVCSNSLVVVKLTNMILVLATAATTIYLTKMLLPSIFRSDAASWWAPPLLVLFNPGILIAESRGGVEVVFGLLISLFIVTAQRLRYATSARSYALCGAVLGATVLVRSTPILFPCALAVYLLAYRSPGISRCRILRNVGVLIFAMSAILSPWIIRNAVLTGKIVPTASVLGVSAQAGQYINSHLFEGRPWWLLDREAARQRDRLATDLGYLFKDGEQGYYQTFYETQDELRFSSYLLGKVIDRYRSSPELLFRCLGQNVMNFWFAGKTWKATAANVMAQAPYLIFALIGVIYSIKNRRGSSAGLLVLFGGYVMVVHLPILAQARYSIPLVPLLSSLSAIGIVGMLRSTEESHSAPTGLEERHLADGELKGSALT